MKRFFAVLTLLMSVVGYADELDVARQALRDGLWSVARTHARQAGGELAQLVVLESFAREDKWSEVLTALGEYGDPAVPDFRYYKAVALYQTGDLAAARQVLESIDFSRGALAADASRLYAMVLRKEGRVVEALERLVTSGDDAESKMVAAAICKAKGDESEAAKLWREVVVMTNAPAKAVAVAAANLPDTEMLNRIYRCSSDADLVRFAGLRLGVLLVRDKDKDAFEEGAKLIRRIVKDSPDFKGAKSAFLVMADAELSRGNFAAAVVAYREALETWPETSKEASVRLGLGWALAETSHGEEALAEFAAIRPLAADDETRALVLVKAGDVLVALGKLEESMASYREVLAKYPGSVAAKKVKDTVELRELEQRGREAFDAYRFEDARKVFAEIARRDPSRSPRMRYCDMVCLYGLGHDEEAERIAVGLSTDAADPSVRSDALLWIAKYLYNRGRYREAESNFLACVGLNVKGAMLAEALLWATRSAFAAGEFQQTVQNASKLESVCPGTRASVEGMLLQAESLIELARFDEAVLVAERVTVSESSDAALRLKAQLLRADALFAMGADNPVRYREALEAYTALRSGEQLEPSVKLRLSYKLAKTLERLKRTDEAIDEYYSRVILAFRDGRAAGVQYDEEAIAAFSRAAFRLAEEYESRGSDAQAVNLLSLIKTASVPASAEAEKRIERIHRKGQIL